MFVTRPAAENGTDHKNASNFVFTVLHIFRPLSRKFNLLTSNEQITADCFVFIYQVL